MTQDRPTRVVAAIVKRKSEEQDGTTIELDIPSFGSSYPVKVDRVPPELAGQLMLGKTYNLALEQQNTKRGKDGSKPWHFYWGLVGLSDDKPPAPAASEARADPGSGRDDPAGRSIERQVALKCAVEWGKAKLETTGKDLDAEGVCVVATRFARWLRGEDAPKPPRAAGQPVTGDLPAPKTPQVAASSAPHPPEAPADTPNPTEHRFSTVTTFWEAVAASGWDRSWVDAQLGGTLGVWLTAVPGRTWDDAYEYLEGCAARELFDGPTEQAPGG